MRSPLRTLVSGAVALLLTGFGTGNEQNLIDRTATGLAEDWPKISAADCSFERNPEHYLSQVRRVLEDLSANTERFRGPGGKARAIPRRKRLSLQAEAPLNNYVDAFVLEKMLEDGIPHAQLSSDAEFLRRVSLDLTGRIPSAAEVREFLVSSDLDKRWTLINRLVDSREFIDKWTMFFGDLLRNTSADTNITRYIEGRNAFYMAIKEFVETRMPYDEFVTRLITASGNTWTNGPGNWLMGAFTPMGPVQDTYDQLAVRAATQFLGLGNLDCLLCHSGAGHLEQLNLWAAGIQRRQAWQMAAFFSRYRSRRSEPQGPNNNVYYWVISDAQAGEYQLNTTAGNRTPRQPSGDTSFVKPLYLFSDAQESGETYREMFARNLVRDRQFARATVNYLWKQMMGLGIVEPADQFDLARLDPSTPLPEGWTLQPSHPELLEALTDDFIRSGFNFRHILQVIAGSATYQLSSGFDGEWKLEYAPYFARKFIRRLTAEEVHDAIAKATNVPGSYPVEGLAAPVQWAMQLPETQGANNSGEPRSRRDVAAFLNVFLRGNRDQIQRSGEATILQALSMMNSAFVLTRIRNGTAGSTVNLLLSNEPMSDSARIEELFLCTLNRFPSVEEAASSAAALAGDRVRGLENLQWALLNKIDFLYNY